MTTTLYGNPPSTTFTQLLEYETADGVNQNIYKDDGVGGVTRMPITLDVANSRVGIMNAAPSVALDVTGSGKLSAALSIGTTISSYNGVATAGYGVPVIRAVGRFAAQTAAKASICTFTPSADGSFEIRANILVTTATNHSFTMTCTYTDEGNTARTLTIPFVLVAGSAIVNTVANATGAVPYMSLPVNIRVKASTAITLQTVGTFTTVTYNVEGFIFQTA